MPTVFRYKWPLDIKAAIVSDTNPGGTITNSDLEMAALFMLWLIIEEVCPSLRHKHVALFSDNSPTVAWVQKMAAKGSVVAAQLLRALAFRVAKAEASPLTPLHIPGKENAMTDIPSRSFGSEPKWHCPFDEDLLRLYNASFPLKQNSWTVFTPSAALTTKVTYVLRMQVSTLAEWRNLKSAGRFTSAIGAVTSGLWGLTLSYRTPPTTTASEPSPASPPATARATTDEGVRWQREQFQRQSRPLARRSPWCSG